MPVFYLLFSALFCLTACQPADTTPVSSLLLVHDNGVKLQLLPEQAPVETPLQLRLTAANIQTIDAQLTGVSMYMGVIPLRFTQQGDEWQAEFFLGACSDPHMLWQLQLELEFTDGQKRTIKQQFQSSWH